MNPMVAAAAIGAGASLLGSAGSAVASAKQAKAQMAFQERMSNTAYQRAAKDLEAAGLNRILALGSPASTPGGAMGQVPDFGSALASGANAATNMAGTASQAALQSAQQAKIVEETIGVKAENAEKLVKSEAWQAIYPAIQAAGGEFSKFASWLTSPENMARIKKAIEDAPAQITGMLNNFLSKIYDELTNITFTDIVQATPAARLYEYAKGRINLGSGGPQ